MSRSLLCVTSFVALVGCGDDGGNGFDDGINTLADGDEISSLDGSGESGSDDVGTTTDATTLDDSSTDGDPCNSVGGNMDIDRFIWIANSAEGTVSKIDTETGVELGRYVVRGDSAGSPSRTSVSRRGDVVVANRLGGVTMIRANKDDCVESNGTPGIQTSTGPTDVLPWGQDECIGWHTPIPHGDNRPVAWTSGFADPDSCEWQDLNVWTAWSDVSLGTAVVALLDGKDGAIIQQVPIPDLPEGHPGWFGFYGGAVDKDDNFWGSQVVGGWLVKVDYNDFSYTSYPVPDDGGYGMTATPDGYIWLCGRSTHRLDPGSGTWTSIDHFNDPDSIYTGGCMGDGDSLLWRGAYGNIMAVDTQTLQVVKQFPVSQPGDESIWGVAIDFDGYVWGVPINGSRAYKVDPNTGAIVLAAEGLVGAYTYSDMTGFALAGVGAIP